MSAGELFALLIGLRPKFVRTNALFSSCIACLIRRNSRIASGSFSGFIFITALPRMSSAKRRIR